MKGVKLTARVQRHATLVEDVWDEQYLRLDGWAGRMTGDGDAGRDVAAEAFARMVARRELPDDPVAFLYRVALNIVRDGWRRQQTADRAAPLLLPAVVLDGPGDGLDVRDVVDRLPSRLRDPIVLFYFADLPVQQVADALGSPVGTVTKRLSEGRAALRLHLETA